jgi:hypothetical protein
MDASLYEDYVLFIKYITDKYGNSDDFGIDPLSWTGSSLNSHDILCC